MPTAFTHPAAALGLFPWFRGQIGRPGVLIAGAALTLLPDLDVFAFRLGIPYEHMLGHRGISHSIAFAFAASALAAAIGTRVWRLHFGLLWSYFFLCLVSHGLLDMVTSGGLGIALFAPFSNERYFFEFRPVRVSSIGMSFFTNGRWPAVLASEARWIWLPALGIGLAGLGLGWLLSFRRRRRTAEAE